MMANILERDHSENVTESRGFPGGIQILPFVRGRQPGFANRLWGVAKLCQILIIQKIKGLK